MAEQMIEVKATRLEAFQSKVEDASQHQGEIISKARIGIYFTKAQLEGVMENSLGGVRVYPGLNTTGEFVFRAGSARGLAGAVFDDGDEANPKNPQTQTNVYYDTDKRVLQLTDLYKNNTSLFKKVYFDNIELGKILENAEGVWFYGTKIKYDGDATEDGHYSLTAVASGAGSSNVALTSLLPCPPNCGGGGAYENDRLQVL